MRRYLVALFFAVVLTVSMQSEESAAATALGKLRALSGKWEGSFEWSGARTDKGKMDANYYVTGNGSAVVEDLLSDGVPMMTSVYHLDGTELRLTHFCAAQNQPRLKAARIDLPHNAVDFSFVDATNLRQPDAPHVHGLEFRTIDADHITLTFLFTARGKESREFIQLRRAK